MAVNILTSVKNGDAMPCEDCPDEPRGVPDDPRKTKFYKELLPNMLTPRKFVIAVEVEALANFQDMEAMSHQVVIAEDETLDALLEEAGDIIDELDILATTYQDEMESVGAQLTAIWPLEANIRVTVTNRSHLPPGTKE